MENTGFTLSGNCAMMGADSLRQMKKRVIQRALFSQHGGGNLENFKADGTDISAGEENDMSKQVKCRISIAGKTVWITGNSYQEAFENYLMRCIDAGIVTPANGKASEAVNRKYNFETYTWNWYNIYKVDTLKPTTLATYESYLKKHLLPHFGKMDIRNISIDEVQRFMNSKAKYAKRTIDDMHMVLGEILEAAKEDGLISINPARSHRLRNPSRRKTTRTPLTTAEAKDVERHLKDIPKLMDRRYTAMLLYCPVRCEDVRGLKVKDIDFERGYIHVERSVTYAKARTYIGEPKTEAGRRTMLLLPELRKMLELTEEELKDPEAFIVHMKDDPHKPLTYQANRRFWERVQKAINVYGKTPHCFRHTFATRAHRAGVDDRTLQSMGGWSDVATMRNVYLHTQEEDYERARGILTAG